MTTPTNSDRECADKQDVPFNKIHHAVCPLCKGPLNIPKDNIFNKTLGEMHVACIILEMMKEEIK